MGEDLEKMKKSAVCGFALAGWGEDSISAL
jgi:hypothetical protein